MEQFLDAFYKTFIYEDRYLYFLEGLKYTLIIALFSCILGLIFGILTSVIRDYHKQTNKLAILSKICDIYVYMLFSKPQQFLQSLLEY